MGLETGTYISDLNANNPVNDTDIVGEGDDHLRLVKKTILNSFPGITGAMSLTHTQLNAAAIKSEANIFTADQRITSNSPRHILYESDAGVDEKYWDIFIDNSVFNVRTRTDADAAGAAPISILRSGSAITHINLNGKVTLGSGNTVAGQTLLRFEMDREWEFVALGEAASNHLGLKSEDQKQFHILDSVDTTIFRFETAALPKFSVFDKTGADSIALSHDGTHADNDYVGTTDVFFGRNNAPADYYRFNTTGTDGRLYLQHAGADVAFFRASATAVEVRSLTNSIGVQLEGADAGGSNRVLFNGDPDGAASMYQAGTARLRTQLATASGNTSGGEVHRHDETWTDIGFNILPEFNTNVSDTLEANHCGSIQRKSTSTARTLTLEANTGTDFPVHGVTTVINAQATGDYTINEGTGVTLYYQDGSTRVDTAGGCTVGPGGVATIWRQSTTVYYIWGSGITP